MYSISVTWQCKLVPVKGQCFTVAEKVTIGLAFCWRYIADLSGFYPLMVSRPKEGRYPPNTPEGYGTVCSLSFDGWLISFDTVRPGRPCLLYQM